MTKPGALAMFGFFFMACGSGRVVTLGLAPSLEVTEPEPVVEPVADDDTVAPEPTVLPMGGSPALPTGSLGGTAGVAAGAGGALGGFGGQAPTGPEPTLSPEPLFGDATLVVELASEEEDENPTLTEDLLQIYFTSRREGGPGNADVWFAERASADDTFGAPMPVDAVSTPEFDSSPAISPDGLTLWTAIDVEGGLGLLDIWVSTRATRSDPWSALVNVTELNSPEDDLPRPIGDRGRVMPIQSRRDGTTYQMYLARRETADGSFQAPVLLDSLLLEGQAMGDGFITYDGLGVYFAYSIEGSGDLYFASRPSPEAEFSNAVPLTTLNTDADERDPWLSADGTRFYFASSLTGVLDIYEARLLGPDGS